MTREFDARELRYGGYLEDYEVGDVYKHWPGKTITEGDNHLFCLITLANSPIHVDANFAKKELPDGKNLVIGTLIYSILTGMSVPDISGRAIASLGVSNLKHVAPMSHGDTLYGSTEILHKRLSASNQERGILSVRTTGINQDGTLVCSFERTVLLPIRKLNS